MYLYIYIYIYIYFKTNTRTKWWLEKDYHNENNTNILNCWKWGVINTIHITSYNNNGGRQYS